MTIFEYLLEYADEYTKLLAQHSPKNNMSEEIEALTDKYALKVYALCKSEKKKPK